MTAGLRLTADRITHRYGDLTALKDISFTAEPGQVTVLVGPSGCGKSTLLGILGGMIQPSAGTVRCDGDIPAGCLNPLTYVFQDFALLPWRSVAGNIALGLEHHQHHLNRAARAARVSEVLDLTGLTGFARAWPRQLSGGMRQRVGIARALAVRPACLLLDEPLSALDAQTRALLLEEFAAIITRAATTAVYVTHNLTEAVRLGHQIIVLSGRPGEIRDILRIDRPLSGRTAADADLATQRERLWEMLRADAAA
jgi:NitT/TauT family transport system ATP-binding protein